jgi:mannose-6-phosphate isomerase-like protein (cupin superfamily)
VRGTNHAIDRTWRSYVTIGGPFDYVRSVDIDQLDSTPPSERYAQTLLDGASGARHCSIAYIRTPPGGGSPAGMHVHEVDQIFFVLEGTMDLEIDGQASRVGPGSLVVFPAGVPHRNWNDGGAPTVHLAFNVPLPDPTKTFAVSVETPVSRDPDAGSEQRSGR